MYAGDFPILSCLVRPSSPASSAPRAVHTSISITLESTYHINSYILVTYLGKSWWKKPILKFPASQVQGIYLKTTFESFICLYLENGLVYDKMIYTN